MDLDRTNNVMEIKDRGLVLLRRLVREDDLVVQILSRDNGRIVSYAFKGARSKRRFVGCDVMKHVRFLVAKGKKGGWILKELVVLNDFSHLIRCYETFQIASQVVNFVNKISPLEQPVRSLYVLLGSFLQMLSDPSKATPAMVHVFETKALQCAGLFSLTDHCLFCKRSTMDIQTIIHPRGLVCSNCRVGKGTWGGLTPQEQVQIRSLLLHAKLGGLFSMSSENEALFLRLKPQVEQIKGDYDLFVPKGSGAF